MEPRHTARANSTAKVTTALMAWDKAPVHIRAMAGAYVGPLLDAMTAMNRELHRLSSDVGDMQTDARIIGGGN